MHCLLRALDLALTDSAGHANPVVAFARQLRAAIGQAEEIAAAGETGEEEKDPVIETGGYQFAAAGEDEGGEEEPERRVRESASADDNDGQGDGDGGVGEEDDDVGDDVGPAVGVGPRSAVPPPAPAGSWASTAICSSCLSPP